MFAQVAAIFWYFLISLHIVSWKHVQTLKNTTHTDKQTKQTKKYIHEEKNAGSLLHLVVPHLLTHVP